MQFDVGTILMRVKDNQEQHRRVALDALRTRMSKERSVGSYLKEAYRKVTSGVVLSITEPYIN